MTTWSSTASDGSSLERAFEPKRGLGPVHGLVFYPHENDMEKTTGEVAGRVSHVTRTSWSLARMGSWTNYKVGGQSFVVEPMGGVTQDGDVDGVDDLEDDSFEGVD